MGIRETILNKNDCQISQAIEVPEWETTVFVKTLNGEDLQAIRKGKDEGDYQVVIRAVCDEQGNNLFTEKDLPLLKLKRFEVINRLAMAVVKHNGMDAGAVEEAKKN